ncbi:phenylalanine--tRNA ligase subunit beta [Flavilitoribacter nigricans]|uniref:Phenylalanine--tRNA ligase beta subunit n=1 Tax=Flavilitoribacter nigricans (strain ATCC 23147 / DSM 23189 / NBRC 102662 / NCIMB 1420 / SS-2) TaxID=1122177 RepID=A0A2D0NHS6_FLAN2|nr:phenylalanine--tRNA ligase subunit beta [Flavilitoribacter nigricans]PHN08027.1 phenylalanine--tRNA ligase subunit beta [Flavilitoribacter nigricans DSM 23189 = NBRC 102662]
MKVSLNWLKDYIDVQLDPETISETLTGTGLEVEGMEEVESIPGGLNGVVVGKVVECGQHPNADRLSLTKVDIGNGEPLSIVCGAPNVAAGQKVMVATVGTTLHPIEGDPLTLKKGKIRGEVSEGMICAEDELGLGVDHSGIMVLPEETPVGQTARDYFNIQTDYIYEIGLTPNRSDATNHIGVARDLAAALKINHDHDGNLSWPSVEEFKIDNNELPVEVVVENTEACPRYTGVSIEGVTIQESPDWLKQRLLAIDVRPINNIVDITNFVLHELGQPLHAFDLDAINGQKIIVKTLPAGSTFVSLDEVERKLDAEDLMICDGDSNGMCIGGVFGGINSGVKDTTRNIFLESAHFDPQYIRRSSMRHNLRTDAAKVFEKGSDPNITLYALKRAALLIKELGGGTIASEIVDIYPNPISEKEIEVAYSYVNDLIGVEISPEKVRAILEAMEMTVVKEDEDRFTVSIPTNKADVLRPADVVEEILRIFGFNNVPIANQIRSAMVISPKPDPGVVKNAIGDLLSANGFFEMMGLSLSESRYYRDLLPSIPAEKLVYINNTSNVQLDIMRPSMVFSGLEAILHNQNRQRSDVKLYEFGRSYQADGEGFEEINHLTLFLSGQRYPESWLNTDKSEMSYYTLKAYVRQVLERVGLDRYQETDLQDETFQYGLRYHRGPQVIVEFGRLSGRLVKGMGIKQAVYYADFNWDTILKSLRKQDVSMQELNKYPRVRRDLALVVGNSVKFNDIASIAKQLSKKILREVNLFDVYVNEEQLGADKKSYAVSFVFEDYTKTLKDKEIDKVMERLIKTYETQLGALIRR